MEKTSSKFQAEWVYNDLSWTWRKKLCAKEICATD